MAGSESEPRYVRPGWFTKHVFNPTIALLARTGVSVWGSRELRVRGRKTGEWRTTPVNPLTYEGNRYAFCGPDCKEAFDRNPEKYATADERQKVGKN